VTTRLFACIVTRSESDGEEEMDANYMAKVRCDCAEDRKARGEEILLGKRPQAAHLPLKRGGGGSRSVSLRIARG
jgi:hypothetical protein